MSIPAKTFRSNNYIIITRPHMYAALRTVRIHTTLVIRFIIINFRIAAVPARIIILCDLNDYGVFTCTNTHCACAYCDTHSAPPS